MIARVLVIFDQVHSVAAWIFLYRVTRDGIGLMTNGIVTMNVAQPPIDPEGIYMTATELAAQFRRTLATIARWAQMPNFPRATALNGDAHWLVTEVQVWCREPQRAYRAALRAKEAAIEAAVEKAR